VATQQPEPTAPTDPQPEARQDAPDQAVEAPAPPAEATAAELEDRWRRTLADLDNLRKRYARELARERAAERARVAAEWLAVLDNLERALAHAEAQDALVEGLRAVRDQAVGVLSALGYPRQDEVGVPFDPARHEAVRVVDDPDAPPGTVVQVLRAGYGAGEGQLRPAAVAVTPARGGPGGRSAAPRGVGEAWGGPGGRSAAQPPRSVGAG